jgi:hypothetical protein
MALKDYEEDRIRRIITKAEDGSIEGSNGGLNQTGAAYTRFLPQICSIEAKKSSSSTSADGVTQLAIWNASLRTRLEQLRDLRLAGGDVGDAHLKELPCLKVDGPIWSIYWIGVSEQGNTVRSMGLYLEYCSN